MKGRKTGGRKSGTPNRSARRPRRHYGVSLHPNFRAAVALAGYVYVIGVADGHLVAPLKIGCTGNCPVHRLGGCNSGSPFPLKIYACAGVVGNEGAAVAAVAAVEARVLDALKARHSHGEWFFVDLHDAVDAINRGAAALSVELHWFDVSRPAEKRAGGLRKGGPPKSGGVISIPAVPLLEWKPADNKSKSIRPCAAESA